VSPRSTCLGGTFKLTGSPSAYHVTAGTPTQTLGAVAYSTKTGAVFGDVACLKGGSVRLTATANDLQLQNVQLIPLQVAAPAPPATSATTPPATCWWRESSESRRPRSASRG
jgi:hypothetical protein